MSNLFNLDIKVTATSRPFRLFAVLSTIAFFGIILDYNFIQSSFLSSELQETLSAQRMLLWLILGLMSFALIIALETPRILAEKKASREIDSRNNFKFLEDTNEKVLLKKTLGGDFDCVKIFEKFNLGVLTLDTQGVIKAANAKFCKKTGFSAPELIGQNVCAVLEDLESNPKHINTSILELSIRHKNGDKEWYYTSNFPLYDEANRIAGSARIIFGVTDMPNHQKHIEKALKVERDLSAMKVSFVKHASHEFRTPLSIIQSNVELISLASHTETSSSSIVKFEKRILHEIDYMTTLMDDVLFLDRIGRRDFKLEFNPVNLVEILHDIQVQTSTLQNDGRSLDLDISCNTISVNLDKQLLQHAIKNVVSNAFKFSQKKNPKMSVTLDKKRISISIKDEGVGISENDKEKIFQPFYRANQGTNNRGAGLGLNIAKEYVEMLGGHLEVESKKNVGTTVIISIPQTFNKIKDRPKNKSSNEVRKSPLNIAI
ncbi:MAG: PAS domain-containing sensor histidine kinase [Crocinitomicaceae bacterium]|nr:PAS domain-containing sensor histidine kinase [Crocinitomicaceae bacterium]MBT5403205.1 PAS domain-containing sensor histidine kinase [Crocinitomicaceae bacterium]MBT6030508.1 PAS domain-containing sensor histidine kinase [Crocinitomicaceae bacterium]